MHKIPCILATPSDPGGISSFSPNKSADAVCCNNDCIDFRSQHKLRGSIASRFRIAALILHCLRLNLTSRLQLQGYVLTACYALSGREFHPTISYAPNWRTIVTMLPYKFKDCKRLNEQKKTPKYLWFLVYHTRTKIRYTTTRAFRLRLLGFGFRRINCTVSAGSPVQFWFPHPPAEYPCPGRN